MHSPNTTSLSWNALWACLAALVVVLVIALGAPAPSAPPVDDPYALPAGQTVDLEIAEKKMKALQRRRDAALQVGILVDDDSSWVKAKLYEGKREWDVRIRLKGDWTDHLEGEKWSFRVEIKDSLPWRRLRVFSLQSPERRGYLNEWFLHRVLMREGLLTPYYEFVHLRLNGHALGIYAVEEHFTQDLLARQQRPSGPILKLDESGMWDARIASLEETAFPYLQTPFFQAASVLPFQKKQILGDSALQVQFEQALRLMQQYREGFLWRDKRLDDSLILFNGTPPPNFRQVFDIRQAAKQYALTDLFSVYHGLIWHNRRYYFNPVTEKLEPVVFDGFSGEVNDTYIPYPFWGYRLCGQSRDDAAYRDITSVYVFQDPDFLRAYYRQLERYCQPSFLDSLFVELRTDLADRNALLRSEYWGYQFDARPIWEQARAILAELRLEERLFAVEVSEGIYCDDHCVRIRNRNPLPVEFWAQGQSVETAQLLEPDCAQSGHAAVNLDVKSGQAIYYRLPGCAQQFVLDWEL